MTAKNLATWSHICYRVEGLQRADLASAITEASVQSDDEPAFDATITDLEGQGQRRLFSSSLGRPRWRWGTVVLLLLAVLVGGELVLAARPLFQQPHTGQVTPLPSGVASPTSVGPSMFTLLATRPPSLSSCNFSGDLSRLPWPADQSRFWPGRWDGPALHRRGWHRWECGLRASFPVGRSHRLGRYAKDALGLSEHFLRADPVRGRRLDEAGVIRLNSLTGPTVAGPLLAELPIMVPLEPIAPPFAPPYQQYGSWYIRFNAPGCYGLQIDWLQGTEWIIFRAFGSADVIRPSA